MRETWVRSLGWEDPWKRNWQPTPAFLPGETHGERRPAGYSPCSHKELETTEQLSSYIKIGVSQVVLVVKSSPAIEGEMRDVGLIPRLEIFPGVRNSNPLQYFAWEIPWRQEAGGLQSIRLQRVGHDRSNLACTHARISTGLLFSQWLLNISYIL